MHSRIFRFAALASSTALGAVLSLAVATGFGASAQERLPTQERAEADELPVPTRGQTSYMPTVAEDFDEVVKRMSANKNEVMERAQALLEERYDLADRPVDGVTMSRGQPEQGGVSLKLPEGVRWQKIAELTPDEIREK